jgi:4-amino-4-deoxy-L-arabinose transferase-like glycosyltransferase
MLAGFGRTYLAVREGRRPRRRDRALFWAGLIAGVLIRGPETLAFAGFTGLVLFAIDRRADWLKTLGWGWGLLALVGLAGPWAVAVTVATDGAYWTAIARPPQPPSPPLWQTWLAPAFLFPLTALIPAAAVYAWREREAAGVRVALAWLLAAWVIVEVMPFKQVFGALPLYIPIAWLGAAGLLSDRVGRVARGLGAILAVLMGAGLGGLAVYVSAVYGVGADIIAGVTAAALFLAVGLAAALAVLRPGARRALMVAAVLAILAPAWLLGATLPSLDRLWPTQRIMRALADNDLDPREGLAVGPVAAAGYHEPSLVFALGASTETGGGELAARAIADGRPAAVEASEEQAFRTGLAALRATAQPIGRIEAYDYAGAREIVVTVYRPG